MIRASPTKSEMEQEYPTLKVSTHCVITARRSVKSISNFPLHMNMKAKVKDADHIAMRLMTTMKKRLRGFFQCLSTTKMRR